ncbi:hypothetical protein [Mucilaginibacter sp.]|jgi:hypothetical protein|uniref:hypothetical protein n=1 Tax=Mucilaginibacter sp. TaxID=1882438 RepID=UPI0035677892
MKKIYALLFITLLGLSFYSCKKDSSEKNTNKIIGEWRVDYRVFEFYGGEKLMDTYTEKYDKDKAESVSLNDDGTGDFKASGEAYTKFNYSVSDTTINFTNASNFYNGKWYPLNDFKYTIITSNNNELYYAAEGRVASPSFYDKYITRIHLVK